MKRKISKSAWDALDAALQALYKKAEGSDSYVLDIEDDDDESGELKRAKDREKKRADKAERELQALREEQEQREAELEEQRVKQGKGLDEAGVAKLKEQHAAALKKAKEDADAREAAYREHVVLETATAMAADISTAPDLLQEKIASRLDFSLGEDGKPRLAFKDADGNLSDKKIEALREEFIADPKYASIIVASKAKGGGASGGSKGGGAPGKKLSEMTATEEAAFANANPEAYQQMIANPQN